MSRLILVVLASLLVAPPAEARVLRSQPRVFPAENLASVRLDFPVGQLKVEGSESDKVRVTLYLHCDRDKRWCEEKAAEVDLDSRVSGDELVIEVEQDSWWSRGGDFWIEAVVQIPRDLELDIQMGVGEMTVEGMRGHMRVRLKVGEVSIQVPEASVKRVQGSVGIGDATIDRREGVSTVSGLLGRDVRWSEGVGPARVDASVGIGELTLRLL
jgi:hypothetical protein